jgi:hypothetical protein
MDENNKSAWVDFGSDEIDALLDARRLSSALGHPVYLACVDGHYYCAPLSKLVGVPEDKLPKNKEFISEKH